MVRESDGKAFVCVEAFRPEEFTFTAIAIVEAEGSEAVGTFDLLAGNVHHDHRQMVN